MNKAVKVRKSLNIKNMKMKCRTKQTFHSHFYSDFSIKKSHGKEEDLCVSEKLSKQETEGRELAKDEEEKA